MRSRKLVFNKVQVTRDMIAHEINLIREKILEEGRRGGKESQRGFVTKDIVTPIMMRCKMSDRAKKSIRHLTDHISTFLSDLKKAKVLSNEKKGRGKIWFFTDRNLEVIKEMTGRKWREANQRGEFSPDRMSPKRSEPEQAQEQNSELSEKERETIERYLRRMLQEEEFNDIVTDLATYMFRRAAEFLQIKNSSNLERLERSFLSFKKDFKGD